MVGFLRDVPTEHLEHLALHVALPKGFDADDPFELLALADAVQDKRLRRVKTVQIVQDGSEMHVPDEEVRTALKSAFGEAYKRGVVRFIPTTAT